MQYGHKLTVPEVVGVRKSVFNTDFFPHGSRQPADLFKDISFTHMKFPEISQKFAYLQEWTSACRLSAVRAAFRDFLHEDFDAHLAAGRDPAAPEAHHGRSEATHHLVRAEGHRRAQDARHEGGHRQVLQRGRALRSHSL